MSAAVTKGMRDVCGLRLALFVLGIAGASPLLAQQPVPAETITVEVSLSNEQQALLSRAEALLGSGQSDAAYEVLAPLESELAGNAFYDYLLGVAALDSGRAAEAVFSLRRSLTVAPAFSGAALELARAYYESGNADLAQPLFERLLDENPPEAARAVINGYLDAIDQRVVGGPVGLNPFVEVQAGYDSNANGSTDAQQFLGFTLNPQNVETDSGFAEFGVGFDWLKVRDQQFAWVGRLRGSHRSNPDASFIDGTLISGLAGFAWQRRGIYGNASVESYGSARDGNSNETYSGLSLMAGGPIGQSPWHLVGNVRAGKLRFDDNLDVMDVDRTLAGLALVRRFAGGGDFTLQALGGDDSEQKPSSPYGNSKSGTRVAVSFPLASDVSLFAAIGVLDSDYDLPFFGTARDDDQRTATLEFNWRRSASLSLVPRIRWIDNESTVALYDYDRTEIGLGVRWTLGR